MPGRRGIHVTGPLAGLRVVELADELGQYAGKLLADMGADVIKVEMPGGSTARQIGPFARDVPGPNRSLNFWYYNTNKRSVVLDVVETGADRELFKRLIATADIFIEANEPGFIEGLGLGYEALRAARPELVMCAITPFGQTGPWAHYRSSDFIGLALGGPMMMNGYDTADAPGAPPIRGHGDQGYHTACHYAVNGILAAILYRDRTGAGQYIDTSMHEALSCTVEGGMVNYLYQRKDSIRQTGRHAGLIPSPPLLLMTSDGETYVAPFGVGRDNQTWNRIKQWMQSEGYGLQFDEPRFDDPLARQPGMGSPVADEIQAENEAFFRNHDAEFLYRGGQERAQAWGIVRAPEETLEDRHWWDRGFFVHTTGEGAGGPVAMPGAPYLLSATPWELRLPAPALGQHTVEVLHELG